VTEIAITRLGHRGDGIGEGPDGRTIYAARTLPGEVIAGEIDGDRIETPAIVAPAAERVSAPCLHYRSCGGCALMHASDSFVADWKTQVIATALAAQGLDAAIRPIATSPPRSRRRATLAGRRTKKGALVGFHARRSDTIVPITDCHVLAPVLMAAVPVLEDITRLGGSRAGVLSFAMTQTESGVDLRVTGGKPLDGPLRAALGGFAGHFVRLTWEDEPIFAATSPLVRLGNAAVTPPPGAFLQATAHGEAALLSAVEEVTDGASRIADLFAGCGTFALCRRLRDAGYAAESLSPDRTQGERFRAELNLPFHACRFEHFEPGHRYDAILISESCQYVPLDRITDQVKRCLKPGGHWLICDYFVQDHAKGRIAKSGHRVSEFKSRARAAGFETVEEVDVTEAASRTLEIANDAIERMILGGEILTEKFRLTRPRLTWLIARLTRKKWKKLQEERVLIDPEAFRNNKRYLFIKYRLPA